MPRYMLLAVHCDPCHRLACSQCVEKLRAEGRLAEALEALAAGDPERLRAAPRRARFERDPQGGPIFVLPFTGKGAWREPFPLVDRPQTRRAFPPGHRRPDGGWTWDLSCPHGHTKPIAHERIRAAFEAFPPGQDTLRIAV